MKKPKTLLLAIIAIMAFFPSQAIASVSYDDNSTILIHQLPTDPIGAPRSPAFNPFTAYLNGNAVILNCSASFGNVAVTVVSTAGDNYTTVFDTEDGSIIISVSGLSGHYTLLLTTASGSQFVGEFEI